MKNALVFVYPKNVQQPRSGTLKNANVNAKSKNVQMQMKVLILNSVVVFVNHKNVRKVKHSIVKYVGVNALDRCAQMIFTSMTMTVNVNADPNNAQKPISSILNCVNVFASRLSHVKQNSSGT